MPLVYAIIGAFEQMVAVVGAGEQLPAPRDDLIARLRGEAPPASAVIPPALLTPPPTRTVRVRADTLDRFLAAVGELMQRHAQLERQRRRKHPPPAVVGVLPDQVHASRRRGRCGRRAPERALEARFRAAHGGPPLPRAATRGIDWDRP